MRFKFVLWWTCNSTRTQAPCHTWLDESLWNDKRHSFVSITLLCTTMSGEDTPRWIYSTVKMPPTCLLFLYKTKGEILPGGEKQHATSLQRQTGKGAAAQHDMTFTCRDYGDITSMHVLNVMENYRIWPCIWNNWPPLKKGILNPASHRDVL